MDCLLFKIAVALVLVMSGIGRSEGEIISIKAGDPNAGAQAYISARTVDTQSQTILDYVKTNKVSYCVDDYTFIQTQVDAALSNLHDQSGEKSKASAALADLAQTKEKANHCKDTMSKDSDQRIRSLLAWVVGQTANLVVSIDDTNTVLQNIVNGQ